MIAPYYIKKLMGTFAKLVSGILGNEAGGEQILSSSKRG